MKTVVISGASGFIASNIAGELKKAGLRTVGISHSASSLPYFDKVYSGRLGSPLPPIWKKENIFSFIHCAHHFGEEEFSINVTGTISWSHELLKAGVPLQIFMSSVSSQKDSPSSYARAKYVLERWFVSHGGLCLRLGLVIGNRGVFGRMISLVKNYPILPLLDKGKTNVCLTGMNFLSDFMRNILTQDNFFYKGKAINFFQPKTVTMKELLNEIKKLFNTSCLLIPVPSYVLLFLIRMMECIPFFPTKVSSNNIIGLRGNKEKNHKSEWEALGYPEKNLKELIQLNISGL